MFLRKTATRALANSGKISVGQATLCMLSTPEVDTLRKEYMRTTSIARKVHMMRIRMSARPSVAKVLLRIFCSPTPAHLQLQTSARATLASIHPRYYTVRIRPLYTHGKSKKEHAVDHHGKQSMKQSEGKTQKMKMKRRRA